MNLILMFIIVYKDIFFKEFLSEKFRIIMPGMSFELLFKTNASKIVLFLYNLHFSIYRKYIPKEICENNLKNIQISL